MAIQTFDLVVIGTGPAGLAAAAIVAGFGGKVLALDEAPLPGGRLPSQIHPEPRTLFRLRRKWSNGPLRARHLFEKAAAAGAQIACGVSVWGVFPGWFVGVCPVDPRQRIGHPPGYEARSVLIATGAAQDPMPLPGWTLPGVLTAGAAQTLVNVQGVLPGKRVAVVGVDPLAFSTAWVLHAVGCEVLGVFLPPDNGLQPGPASPAAAVRQLGLLAGSRIAHIRELQEGILNPFAAVAARCFPESGIRIGGVALRLRQALIAVAGRERVEAVETVALQARGGKRRRSSRYWPVDAVVTAAGLYPLAELAKAAGCPVAHVRDLGGWVPVHSPRMETTLPGLFVAGSITGVEGATVAQAQGHLAGLVISGYLGLKVGRSLEGIRTARESIAVAREGSFRFLPRVEAGRAFMERCWKKSRPQTA